MMILKNRIIQFLLIVSAILLIDLISFKTALYANTSQIIIDENLKTGMTYKDAIELLGPPEKMEVSDTGTINIHYDSLGLSIELKGDGTVIERIRINHSFKGRFASGIEIGADYQKILSEYNQPDIMTKEMLEYSNLNRIFQIQEGKLVGADLYSAASPLSGNTTKKEPVKYTETKKEVPEEVNEEVREALREELREEVREELREEVRENVIEEVIKDFDEEFDVFDFFGFKVKQTFKGAVITEIRPDSVAERGGLKVGEPIRKAFYNGGNKLNIYHINGLEKILKRAIKKYKKTVYILQDRNSYYKIDVPKRN